MSRAQAGLLGAAAGIVAGAVLMTFVINGIDFDGPDIDALGRNEIASNGAVQGRIYAGMPEFEARLVQIEDERLVYVRTIASVARWGEVSTDGPYRLNTGETFTLVLTARDEPYTVADLVELAPDTFIEKVDNTYLLSESIIVLEGASLDVSSDEDLTIRLASDSSRFVSIVTLGGSLTVAGSETGTVAFESWDSENAAPDASTDDGRAYIRAIGGQASLSHASFSDLGFWSGNTGGLALTGNDAVGTFDVNDNTALTEEAVPEVAGALLLPAGALTGYVDAAEINPFVSATVDNVTLDGNAFGLFVTSAVSVEVSNTTITNSLVDGLVFHRFVTDSSVTDTTSSNNAVDGFTLARSSTGVVFDRVEASDNGRNGISLDGQPLADGPSAIGTQVESYGDNTITDSTLIGNGRYGVEISGGRDVTLTANAFDDNQVGVVVNHGSDGALITANTFGTHDLQSVAVRDGVTGAEVHSNTFSGGDTAIYVRNADAEINDNSISRMSNHGITIMGDASGVTVDDNTIGGFGRVPIYDRQAIGQIIGENDVDAWQPAATPATVIRSIFQPLTIVWLVLALLLLATAIGPRSLRFGTIRHPYPDRVPLQSLSRGVVPRHALSRAPE